MSEIPRGAVADYLGRDHERLDALLRRAASGGPIDVDAYEAFRGGLLRHIGIEEKILIPSARSSLPAEELAVARQLKLDHAALAALLVPTPTPAILEQLQTVLAQHNRLEEGAGGFYEACVRVSTLGEDALLARVEAAPEVPLAAHYDGARARASIDRLLRLAGRIPA
jgi:hypothetical protein